jgi:hypothetical protein
MNIMRKLVPITLIACLLLAIPAPTLAAAAAEPSDPAQHQLSCQEDGCTIEIDFEQVPEPARFATNVVATLVEGRQGLLPQGSRIELNDDLLLTLPAGELSLPNAQLTLAVGEDNQVERLHGTAQVSFPNLGIFDKVQIQRPLTADIGLERGSYLDYLHLPLDPDRPYLLLRVGTGLDMTTQLDGDPAASSQVRLTAPQGQNVTLVLDTAEPLVYVAGNLTLHHNGPVALVSDVLDGDGNLGLGLPGRTTLHISGLLADDPSQTYLRLEAGHTIEAGLVGELLQLEAAPIAVQGVLTARPSGLLLQGTVLSELQPDVAFDGDLQLEAFLPFRSDPGKAYVQLDGHAAIPVARLQADVSTQWSPAQKDLAQRTTDSEGIRRSEIISPDDPPILDEADREIEKAIPPVTPPLLAQVKQVLSPWAEGISQRASQGGALIGETSGTVWAWVTDQATTGQALLDQKLATGTR